MDKPTEDQIGAILDYLQGIMAAAQHGSAYLALGRIEDIAEAARVAGENAAHLREYISDLTDDEEVQFTPEPPKGKGKKPKVVDLVRYRDG